MATVRKKPVKVSRTRNGIDELVIALAEAKDKAKIAAQEAKDIESTLMALLDADEVTTHRIVTNNGRSISVTKVVGTRTVIDEDRLKKVIGASMFNQVTTRHLDKGKLDAFVKAGDIKAIDVASASQEFENAPYLRVTK